MTTDGAAAVNVANVAFNYESGVLAIDELSMSVRRGSHVGIVGPSGCGKSTFLRLLAGLEKPTRGTIQWNAQSGFAHPLAMVFQEDTLLPWLTVQENVEFYYRLHPDRATDVRARTLNLLKLAGLSEFARAYPYQLSGGMRRRTAFLTAVAPLPAVLLLDEPFSSLDEPTRVSIHQDVFEIMREFGMTVVLVTHDLAEAISLCDEVVILTNRPGRVFSRREIPFGRTRKVLELRQTREFLDLYAALWGDLRQQLRMT
jgi:NitT/TauT family transport system ATP-binding protein